MSFTRAGARRGAPSRARIHLLVWLAIAFGSTRAARADDFDAHELLARFRIAAYPVVVVGATDSHVAFVHTHTWGGRLFEYGEGPVNILNTLFLGGAGASNVHQSTWSSGGQTYSGYSYSGAGGGRAEGRLGHWSLDLSDDVFDFDANTFFLPWLGFRLEFTRLLGYDIAQGGVPEVKRTAFLMNEGGGRIDDLTSFDVAFVPRLPLLDGPEAGLDAQLNLPVMYLAAGLIMEAVDDRDGSWKDAVYLFGFPDLSVNAHVRLGRVALRASVSVPVRFLVIPWYFRATQVGFDAGFAF